ncbi:MAG: hypothetical protein JWO07_263 [Candidatus Saccharibacteria bacterium]|nr:hypothetical protein [Candidatus Saccharibacteria bacterium]
MKIIVVGGSRGIGLQVVITALDAGHEVTIFSRRPDVAGLKNPKVSYVSGSVLDEKSLSSAIKGHDVVICALGLSSRQAIGPPLSGRSKVLSRGTQNIIAAMHTDHVRRLLCVTAIATGDSKKQCTWLARVGLTLGLRWLFIEKNHQELLIQKSGLDWTIFRPTALTNGHHHGELAPQNRRFGMLSHISRADVARAMIDSIHDGRSYKKALILSYEPRFGDSVRWLAGYFEVT